MAEKMEAEMSMPSCREYAAAKELEVTRLRAELAAMTAERNKAISDFAEQCDLVDAMHKEVSEARGYIKCAPHSTTCRNFRIASCGDMDGCNCWKAEALREKVGHA
jgi:hypothetical protein